MQEPQKANPSSPVKIAGAVLLILLAVGAIGYEAKLAFKSPDSQAGAKATAAEIVKSEDHVNNKLSAADYKAKVLDKAMSPGQKPITGSK